MQISNLFLKVVLIEQNNKQYFKEPNLSVFRGLGSWEAHKFLFHYY